MQNSLPTYLTKYRYRILDLWRKRISSGQPVPDSQFALKSRGSQRAVWGTRGVFEGVPRKIKLIKHLNQLSHFYWTENVVNIQGMMRSDHYSSLGQSEDVLLFKGTVFFTLCQSVSHTIVLQAVHYNPVSWLMCLCVIHGSQVFGGPRVFTKRAQPFQFELFCDVYLVIFWGRATVELT